MPEQTQFKRAIGIFSVISSPSRLEILRQLNAKGPMSYSELKASTGFRAKKESGKFAYHLRKLLKQGLIAHNKLDKKYSITPLGRLVLNATREIDERALLQTGQLTVRTNKETIEPFHVNKIMQTLIRESNMPHDLAQKISVETEYIIYGVEDIYVTASKIRELINCMLLREGKEEYRDRLARLGVSVYDFEDFVFGISRHRKDLCDILSNLGKNIVKEYALFNSFSRDVTDAHLNGTINISDPGTSILSPDFLVLPSWLLKDLAKSRGISENKALMEIARNIRYETALILGNEDGQQLAIDELSLLAEISGVCSTINLLASHEKAASIIQKLAGGQQSKITISAITSSQTTLIDDIIREARLRGIALSVTNPGNTRTYWGLRVKDENEPVIGISSVSINMPRIAYEAQGDEVYFKAKALQVAEKAQEALRQRLKQLMRRISRLEIFAKIASIAGKPIEELIEAYVNLVGYRESLSILGTQLTGEETLNLIGSLASESWEKGASILYDPRAGARLYEIDTGKIAPKDLPREPGWTQPGYTTGYYLTKCDVEMLAHALTTHNVTPIAQAHEIKNNSLIAECVEKLGAISILPNLKRCTKCGELVEPNTSRCPKCGGASYVHLYEGSLF